MTNICESAFSACFHLSSINIGNSVTTIGDYAFYYCSELTSITIPNSVTSIGTQAFDYSGLTSITIPNSVTSIGSSAFAHTAWYYNQPDGLVYAGKVAIGYKGEMPSNTSVTLENGTVAIADYAFSGCSDLTSINIPNSVTSIGSNAFNRTAWYDNQPDGLVYAGKVAYKYKGTMPSNTSITLQDGTVGIAGSAFFWCNGLTSITIPNSVTSIGDGAFDHCFGLTSVTVKRQTPVAISSDTFSNQANVTLYVPAGCKAAYEAADYWKEFKEIVEVGSGDVVMGDVNGSGDVTPADAIMILYYFFGVEQQGFNAAAADLNKDGEITPADAIEALYLYFGAGNGNARAGRTEAVGRDPE